MSTRSSVAVVMAESIASRYLVLGGVSPGGGGAVDVSRSWAVCSEGLFQGCEQLSGACIQKLVDRVADIHDVAEGR